MRLLSMVALEVTGTHPGIASQAHICGDSARIIRTRIPVWLLEALRRDGRSEAELLADYPSLTAEDLTNAWHYARSQRRKWTAKLLPNETKHDRPTLSKREFPTPGRRRPPRLRP